MRQVTPRAQQAQLHQPLSNSLIRKVSAHRFHLGAGDLLLGELYAAVDMFLQRLACLRSKGLCLKRT